MFRRFVPIRERFSRSVIIGAWLPLFAWVVVTHLFSTDAFSSDESSRFIVPILTFLFPGLSPAGLDFAHLVVRKAGHVMEYFIMGILAYRAFHTRFAALLFVLVAAFLNEGQQLFTATRTGSIVDVGYNLVGGVLGVWFCMQFAPLVLKRRVDPNIS